MASEKITRHEQSLLESLCYAAHGISAPFACSGALVTKRPVTICFPDKTKIIVPRAKDTYEQGATPRAFDCPLPASAIRQGAEDTIRRRCPQCATDQS
jgi:hypothetical protein